MKKLMAVKKLMAQARPWRNWQTKQPGEAKVKA